MSTTDYAVRSMTCDHSASAVPRVGLQRYRRAHGPSSTAPALTTPH